MPPQVQGVEAYWEVKQRAREAEQLGTEPAYEAIEMPRNSMTGFVCAFFATIIGFAYTIPADEVARIDRGNREARQQALMGASAA